MSPLSVKRAFAPLFLSVCTKHSGGMYRRHPGAMVERYIHDIKMVVQAYVPYSDKYVFIVRSMYSRTYTFLSVTIAVTPAVAMGRSGSLTECRVGRSSSS